MGYTSLVCCHFLKSEMTVETSHLFSSQPSPSKKGFSFKRSSWLLREANIRLTYQYNIMQ